MLIYVNTWENTCIYVYVLYTFSSICSWAQPRSLRSEYRGLHRSLWTDKIGIWVARPPPRADGVGKVQFRNRFRTGRRGGLRKYARCLQQTSLPSWQVWGYMCVCVCVCVFWVIVCVWWYWCAAECCVTVSLSSETSTCLWKAIR